MLIYPCKKKRDKSFKTCLLFKNTFVSEDGDELNLLVSYMFMQFDFCSWKEMCSMSVV